MSSVEVSQISRFGIWLLAEEREFFLPYEECPWFQKATVEQIHRVRLLHGTSLRWEDLDVDLELASLENLEQYPLIHH